MIIRNDGKCPKNLHTDRRKEFYNSEVQKLLKKHNINSTYLLYVIILFHNEGLDRQTVQSYIKERHVKIIYIQWKLQMDLHPAASRIKL